MIAASAPPHVAHRPDSPHHLTHPLPTLLGRAQPAGDAHDDWREPAQEIGSALGLDAVLAEQTPVGKVENVGVTVDGHPDRHIVNATMPSQGRLESASVSRARLACACRFAVVAQPSVSVVYRMPGLSTPGLHGCVFGQLPATRARVAMGSVIVKRAPAPGPGLCAVRVPPWASTSVRAMVSPIPLPPSLRPRAVSAR